MAALLSPPPLYGPKALRGGQALTVTTVAFVHAALVWWIVQPSSVDAEAEPIPMGSMAVTWVPLSAPAVQPTQAPTAPVPPTARPVMHPAALPSPAPVTAPAERAPTPEAVSAPTAMATPVPTPASASPTASAPTPVAAIAPLPPKPVAPLHQDTPVSYDAAYLDNPQPVYPPASRAEGEQGEVRLRVHVQANGLPDRVEVSGSSGFSRLDKAARSAVSRWRFTPAKVGEQAVADWVTVPIVFALK